MPLLYPRLPVDQPAYTQRMYSVAYNTVLNPCSEGRVTSSTARCTESYTEVVSTDDAIEELFKLVSATMSTDEPIILRCNLPTGQSSDASAGLGFDMIDLRALHAKSLGFVHKFIARLKATGHQASYKLTVSAATTSCALIRVTSGDPYVSSPQHELDKVCTTLKEKLQLVQRDRLYITTLCSIPALVIS